MAEIQSKTWLCLLLPAPRIEQEVNPNAINDNEGCEHQHGLDSKVGVEKHTFLVPNRF